MADFDGVIDPPVGWPDIPQLSVEAVALGGIAGAMNAQARALAARDKYLNQRLERFERGVITTASYPIYYNDPMKDSSEGILQFIADLQDSGKVGLVLPGTIYIDGSPQANIENNLVIEGSGAKIVGLPGTGWVLRIAGTGSYRPNLTIHGLTIDNSQREFMNAEASGTALALARLSQYEIFGFSALSTMDYRDGMGDSGITINECRNGRIFSSYFRGQPDLGVYATGGASTGDADDGGELLIFGSIFDRCSGAAASKRQGRLTQFLNNQVRYGRVGFSNSEAGGVPPGRELIVDGNLFYHVESRAAHLRRADFVSFRNNTVINWGVTPEGGNASMNVALQLLGCDGAMVTGNRLMMAGVAASNNQLAISMDDYTLDSVTYRNENNLIDGNYISGCPRGIRERHTATGNLGTNVYSGVATPLLLESPGSTSKYGIRTTSGINRNPTTTVGRDGTAVAISGGTGVALEETGRVVSVTDNTNNFEGNRNNTPGYVYSVRYNGSQVGGIDIEPNSGRARTVALVLPDRRTTAELNGPSYSGVTAGTIAYATDGAAGIGTLCVRHGGQWLRIQTGPEISAT